MPASDLPQPQPQPQLRYISANLIELSALVVSQRLVSMAKDLNREVKICGIPRGGVCAAYAIAAYTLSNSAVKVIDSFQLADVIVDDLVDSGVTRERFRLLFPNKPFAVLFDKHWNVPPEQKDWIVGMSFPGDAGWLVFPWEDGYEPRSSGV